MAKVQVDLIGDAKDVSREINKTIREVSLLGQAIDTSNDIAVKTWKKAADAAKEYLAASTANTEQQLKLEIAMRRTEERISRHAGETASSTRNMGFFSALVAEATGHLGEHSLAIGRVERNLASFAEHSLGVNSTLGLLATSLGKFAIGSIEITAVLAGIDAVVAIYDKLTEGTRKAKEEQDKLVDALASWGLPKTGPRSAIAREYEAALKQQAEDVRHLKMLLAAKNDFQVALAYQAAGEAAPTRTRQDEIDALTKDLARVNVALADARVKGAAEGKLKDVRIEPDKALKGLEGAELAQLHDAVRIGSAAIAALEKRMKDDEKARHELGLGDVHLAETKAAAMDVSSPQGALSQLEVIKTKHDLRIKEIDQMNIDNDLKLALQKQADDEEVAQVEELNRRLAAAAAKRDAEARKDGDKESKEQTAIVKKRAEMIYQAENGMAQAIISGRKDLGRQLLRAALEPEVKLMEGLAAKQFALAAGDFADGNWAGGAHHLQAGAVFATEAAVIAGIAQGGGGGGGGGSSGGAAGSAGAQLGARGTTSDQIVKMEIVVMHQDPTGREISRTNQMIQRQNDLNMPIRVAL